MNAGTRVLQADHAVAPDADASPHDPGPHDEASGPPRRTPWARTLGVAVLAACVVSLVLLAFAWPSVTSEAKDIPVAVVGTEEQITVLEQQAPEGVLDVTEVDSRDAAVRAIETRESYGAIVLGTDTEFLVSSAASPAVAQSLRGMATTMQQGIQTQTIQGLQDALAQAGSAAQGTAQSGDAAPAAPPQPAAAQTPPTVTVTDVVPLSEDDPNGSGLTVAGLPLVMGGMIGGMLIALTVRGTWRKLAALAAYGVVAGLALAGILQGWLGIVQGDFWPVVAAAGLGVVGTSSLLVGLDSLLGRAGLGLGALTTLLLANPISGLSMPKEFLPGAWGEVGQWFVPGASGTLLRDLSYFPAADVTFSWWVLVAWVALGLAFLTLGRWKPGRAQDAHH